MKSHGKDPVTLDSSDPGKVDEFVAGLGEALTKDMAELKETELDHAGGYEWVDLHFKDGEDDRALLFVDKLRRLVVPDDPRWKRLECISFEGEHAVLRQRVVRKENRYEGDRVCAIVIYAEAKNVGMA